MRRLTLTSGIKLWLLMREVAKRSWSKEWWRSRGWWSKARPSAEAALRIAMSRSSMSSLLTSASRSRRLSAAMISSLIFSFSSWRSIIAVACVCCVAVERWIKVRSKWNWIGFVSKIKTREKKRGEIRMKNVFFFFLLWFLSLSKKENSEPRNACGCWEK